MSPVAPPEVRARAFDAWADEYDRFRPGYPAASFAAISEHLQLPPGAAVLDLGAGTGNWPDDGFEVPSVVDCWLARRKDR